LLKLGLVCCVAIGLVVQAAGAAGGTPRVAMPVPPSAPALRVGGGTGLGIGAASLPAVRSGHEPRGPSTRRRERRLRRLVESLSGCLPGLPRTERRVLALRAGVGTRRPLSRAAVARRLHIDGRRVRHLERRGLRRLRRLARDGRCGNHSGSAGTLSGAALGGKGREWLIPLLLLIGGLLLGPVAGELGAIRHRAEEPS
jgi:hypothetical protein